MLAVLSTASTNRVLPRVIGGTRLSITAILNQKCEVHATASKTGQYAKPGAPNRIPLFFLSVGGVITPLDTDGKGIVSKWPEMKEAKLDAPELVVEFGRSKTVTWAPKLIEQINKWHDDGLAQFCWLTSWRELAPRFLAPTVGLREFYVAGKLRDMMDASDEATLPKGLAGHEELESDAVTKARPVVWVDQHMDLIFNFKISNGGYSTHDRIEQPISEYWRTRPHTLLVSPVVNRGLTPAEIELIDAFLNNPHSNADNFVECNRIQKEIASK